MKKHKTCTKGSKNEQASKRTKRKNDSIIQKARGNISCLMIKPLNRQLFCN